MSLGWDLETLHLVLMIFWWGRGLKWMSHAVGADLTKKKTDSWSSLFQVVCFLSLSLSLVLVWFWKCLLTLRMGCNFLYNIHLFTVACSRYSINTGVNEKMHSMLILTNVPLYWGMLVMGEAIHVCRQGVYGKYVCLLFSFAVNLKHKVYLKKEQQKAL